MRISALAVIIALGAGAAQAQDAYVGVALDYGTPHAGEDQALATLLGGVTFDLGTMSLGAEVEYGAAAALAGDYDTARVRFVGGYDFGDVTALATFGATRYDAGAVTTSGYNYGIGAQFGMTDALDLRGEIMRDMMGTRDTNTTTTRIAAIYSF